MPWQPCSELQIHLFLLISTICAFTLLKFAVSGNLGAPLIRIKYSKLLELD
uniref:Uncharacterized protein n=1 Tax=Arundo donax TaxID=35708 RepID=A0A0A9AGG4_ARUDO